MDYPPNIPYGKGGFDGCTGREGGGREVKCHRDPGVISPMNPGPYRPLCVGGAHVGGFQTNRPSPGGSSSRPMVGPPAVSGTVPGRGDKRQTFLALRKVCARCVRVYFLQSSDNRQEHFNSSFILRLSPRDIVAVGTRLQGHAHAGFRCVSRGRTARSAALSI